MLLTCPGCQRRNPPDALFCYFDGIRLPASAPHEIVDPARKPFPMPFVFASSTSCLNFDQLALAIQNNWQESLELLRAGVFANFLAGLGRGDLALLARRVAMQTDLQAGLDELLRRLPTKMVESAKIRIDPDRLNLGILSVGLDVNFDLQLLNDGMGIISGSISCEETPWLAFDLQGTRRKVFQFRQSTSIPIHILGKALTAQKDALTARLRIESNGGIVDVPILLEVPIRPFPGGLLQGATSPRQIAEKAKSQPKEAGEWFANGAVARWYQDNGWTYPVKEPAATGIAAVQQFFEALGLTAAPKVTIDTSDIRLFGRKGDRPAAKITLSAEEKKPVYAHALSDQSWCKIERVELDGRKAVIHVRAEVPDRGGETLRALVGILSNGRTKFQVRVELQVDGEPAREVVPAWSEPQKVSSASASIPEPRVLVVEETILEAQPTKVNPIPAKPAVKKVTPSAVQSDADYTPPPKTPFTIAAIKVLLPVFFIVASLTLTVVRDLAVWMNPGAGAGFFGFGGIDISRLPRELHLQFHDREEEVRLTKDGAKPMRVVQGGDSVPALWEPSMRFGLSTRGRGDQRLTFDAAGRTNNTVIKLDDNEWIFGERPFKDLTGKELDRWPGRWLQREAPLENKSRRLDSRRSIWIYDEQQVSITQTVSLVAGDQTGKVDTCLIEYRMENRDTKEHIVGLRFLLDTFIGRNDGVPFLIPTERSVLCNTQREMDGEEVPAFIQARERDDLENPGTIALVQLRIPGMDPPSRVTLGAWPNKQLRGLARQEKTLWTVPVLNINQGGLGDSAVVIYWNPKILKPGEKREVAFAYGLGSVSASEGGQLALTAVGEFTPGGEFTLTAEVRNPIPGQTVKVELPEGFQLTQGTQQQEVSFPAAGGSISPVTWKIRGASKEGVFGIKVTASSGASQTKSIRLKTRGIFGG